MQTALRLKTTVLPGGKIEFSADELVPGEAVEVIILLPEAAPISARSAVDILDEAPGQHLFKSAQEVSDFLHAERDAWER